MKEKMSMLKQAREDLEGQKKLYDSNFEQFKVDNEHLIGGIKDSKEIVNALESDIKAEAIELYDGSVKKFDTGVGIRVTKKLNYAPLDAFGWALEHRLCLTLDKKAFETVAKTQELDFVKTEEVVTATIPKEIKVIEDE
jgi:hypothetical protein